MPLTPAQIKDKLINALDDDKNVIDEEAIEEVITLLEASTLTKEILEQTRLGRDINLVRKTCKNPVIAKRAKNLVKTWQKLLVQPGSPHVPNGQHPCVPSPQRASPALRVSPGLSPALVNKCLPSPALAQVRQQQLKVAGSRSPVIQGVVKQTTQPTLKSKSGLSKSPRPVTRSASISLINEDSNLSWPGTPPVTNENSQDRLTAGDSKPDTSSSGTGKNVQSGSQKRHFNFDPKLADHSTVATSKSNRASDQRDVSKTNVANRKRTREQAALDESSHTSSDIPLSKQPCLNSSSSLSASALSKNDVINGTVSKKLKPQASTSSLVNNAGDSQDLPEATGNHSSPRMALPRQDSVSSRLSMQSVDSRLSRSKSNRVKTTEQLIEEMQLRSATSVGTDVIAQIRTQQIQKESDQPKPDLSKGGKRRGRKKKKGTEQLELPDLEAVSEGRKLAQAKSEYIERFLQTSVAPTPGEDIYEAPISHSKQESLEEQPLALGECSSTFSQSQYESGFPSYPSRQDKPDSGPSASPPDAREILESTAHAIHSGSLSDASTLARFTEEQILALLPPVDFGNIDWTSHDYSPPQRVQVGPEMVDRLHSENMDGVNGTYDRDGQFQGWAQMLTMDSVYDEPLYILPYVIPND